MKGEISELFVASWAGELLICSHISLIWVSLEIWLLMSLHFNAVVAQKLCHPDKYRPLWYRLTNILYKLVVPQGQPEHYMYVRHWTLIRIPVFNDHRLTYTAFKFIFIWCWPLRGRLDVFCKVQKYYNIGLPLVKFDWVSVIKSQKKYH